MQVQCDKCHIVYDDARRWTICPHSPLECAVDDLCPKCDTLKSVHGPCRHQLENQEQIIVTLDNYQSLAMRTKSSQEVALSRINVKNVQLLHCVIGMMGELGELAGALEKHIWYGKDFDAVNFSEELGDTAWYMVEGSEALADSLVDILTKNINKLRVRYPQKYSDQHAAEENRNRAAERAVLEDVVSQMPLPVKPSDWQLEGIDRLNQDTPIPITFDGKRWGLVTGFKVTEKGEIVADVKVENSEAAHNTLKDFFNEDCCERTQTGSGFAEPPDDSLNVKDPSVGKIEVMDAILDPEKRSKYFESYLHRTKNIVVDLKKHFESCVEGLVDEAAYIHGYKEALHHVLSDTAHMSGMSKQVAQDYADRELGPIKVNSRPNDPIGVPVVDMAAVPVGPGDGLVRKDIRRDSSYDRFCIVCNRNVVHRSNSTQTCPDCVAKQHAKETLGDDYKPPKSNLAK